MPNTSDTDPTLDLDAVERIVDQHRAAGHEPGLAYGVIHRGSLVHAGGRGERDRGAAAPDLDTVFRIASMTKSFTAATVLLLRDEGRLRLDDEVTRYVPEAAGLRPPTDDSPPLTIRSLLTMAAGLPTDDPWGDRQQDLPDDDFAALVAKGLSFAWTPGTAFEYSNLGYALLGRVIAAAAGQPYADVVSGRLLAPLGLTSTGWRHTEVPPDRLAQGFRRPPDEGCGWQPVPFAGHGSFAPMGGLFSTVRDLARWVGGLTGAFPPRDGDADDDHPLRRCSRREQQFPHLALPPVVRWHSIGEPPVVRGAAYGLGLIVEHDPQVGALVSHSGGYPGFGSHMRWHPGTGLGVVVLGNATYAPVARLGAQLLEALLAPEVTRHSLLGVPGTSPTPATGSLLAATASARTDVVRLLTGWDDALADRLFAVNMDLDEPLPTRRAAIEHLAATLGPLTPDDASELTSTSPAHCAWWMRGPGGRVRVEIRLTPELPPRVQTLTVTAVPEPPATLRRIADRVAHLLGDDARWPAEVPLAPPLEIEALSRQLAVGAAWAGRSHVVEVLAGDGQREATFRLDGERASLELTLTADQLTGLVFALSLTPAERL